MVLVDFYDNQAGVDDRWYTTEQCINCSYINFPSDRKEARYVATVSLVEKATVLRQLMQLGFPLIT